MEGGRKKPKGNHTKILYLFCPDSSRSGLFDNESKTASWVGFYGFVTYVTMYVGKV